MHSIPFSSAVDAFEASQSPVAFTLVPQADLTAKDIRDLLEEFKLRTYSTRPTQFATHAVSLGSITRFVAASWLVHLPDALSKIGLGQVVLYEDGVALSV